MMRRLRSFSLENGLAYIRTQPYRKVDGEWIENCRKQANTRLRMFELGQTDCVTCGLKGTHFHIERAINDKLMPFSVNLYGVRGGQEIMMTWDHALPRSLGGSNMIENAQCMCRECNERKGKDTNLRNTITMVILESKELKPLIAQRRKPQVIRPSANYRDSRYRRIKQC